MTVQQIVFNIAFVVCSSVDGYLTQKLFRAFVVPKFRFRGSEYAVGVFWTGLNILLYALIDTGTYEPISFVKLMIYTLGLVLFSVIWYEGGILQRIFPAVLYSAIWEICVQLSACFVGVNGLIVDFLWLLSDNDIIIPYDIFIPLITVITTAVVVIIEAIREVFIFFAVKGIVSGYRFKLSFSKETVLYLLPSFVGLMMCAILRLIVISVDSGYTRVIYERYPLLYVIVPLTSALLLFSIIYSFRLYQDMAELRQGQADKAVLQSQLSGIKNALAEKEQIFESRNAVRHDIKNSLTALSGLIRRKCPDDEEINRFFESMSLSFEKAESRVKTGNAVCDTIISGKFFAAEKAVPGIKLDASGFFFSGETLIDPYDMGIILSNGLDNAIEACVRYREKEPQAGAFMTVRSFTRKNMYFAEIENSFDGIYRIDKKSGLPFSRKENDGLHGIGLRNIKACAEKYSGSMELIVAEKSFILSVMMKIK